MKTPPVFDEKSAQPIKPRRHETTGRTCAFTQADGDVVHLFSATGVFIATEPVDPAAPAPAAP